VQITYCLLPVTDLPDKRCILSMRRRSRISCLRTPEWAAPARVFPFLSRLHARGECLRIAAVPHHPSIACTLWTLLKAVRAYARSCWIPRRNSKASLKMPRLQLPAEPSSRLDLAKRFKIIIRSGTSELASNLFGALSHKQLAVQECHLRSGRYAGRLARLARVMLWTGP